MTHPAAAAALARTPHTIDDSDALARACGRWRAQAAIGVDTEFVRERTFFPALGLIQVADETGETLIDTVAIDDLEPLAEVLQAPAVTKVFHACGEDLEVLHHALGSFPRPLFDTQIAAALLGHGMAMGYGRMVADRFGIELPSGQTRTNWLRRPLTEAQKRYAALDVAFLLPTYRDFTAELAERGRTAWLAEEVDQLSRRERFLPEPDDVHRRIKGAGGLDPQRRAVLQALTAWREREARHRDLPRNFVLREDALVALARARPRNAADLDEIEELPRRARGRYAAALLEAVARGGEAAPLRDADLGIRRPANLTLHRRTVKALQAAVRQCAEALDIPPELLASKKTLTEIALSWQEGGETALDDSLGGWRSETAAGDLADVLRRALGPPANR